MSNSFCIAKDNIFAEVGKSSDPFNEGLETHGRYEATASGPVESLRWLYVKLSKFILTNKDSKKWSVRLAKAVKSLIPIELKWNEVIHNLTTYQGRNHMLDTYLNGNGWTAYWYIGLVSLTSYSAISVNDTASSHAGWVEDVEYSETTRPICSWSTASSGSKTISSACVFSINGDGTTIKGCFLTNYSTKGGSSGTLFSVGLFTSGDKVLGNGDTLNVSYTATVS